MFAAFLSAFGGLLVYHLANHVAGGEIYAYGTTCPKRFLAASASMVGDRINLKQIKMATVPTLFKMWT